MNCNRIILNWPMFQSGFQSHPVSAPQLSEHATATTVTMHGKTFSNGNLMSSIRQIAVEHWNLASPVTQTTSSPLILIFIRQRKVLFKFQFRQFWTPKATIRLNIHLIQLYSLTNIKLYDSSIHESYD